MKLDELARANALSSAFDPELFPGLRLKLRYPHTVVLVFRGGKCVIAGCRDREEISRAWAAVQLVVKDFLWDECEPGAPPTHTDAAAERSVRRKCKITG